MPGVVEVSSPLGGSVRSQPIVVSRDNWSVDGQAESNLTPLGLSIERDINNKRQRVIILGDADFLTSSVILSDEYTNNLNYLLLVEVYRWLSHGRYPVDLSRPTPKDVKVRIQLHEIDFVKAFYYGVFPGFLLVFGAGLLILRRRH